METRRNSFGSIKTVLRINKEKKIEMKINKTRFIFELTQTKIIEN